MLLLCHCQKYKQQRSFLDAAKPKMTTQESNISVFWSGLWTELRHLRHREGIGWFWVSRDKHTQILQRVRVHTGLTCQRAKTSKQKTDQESLKALK